MWLEEVFGTRPGDFYRQDIDKIAEGWKRKENILLNYLLKLLMNLSIKINGQNERIDLTTQYMYLHIWLFYLAK